MPVWCPHTVYVFSVKVKLCSTFLNVVPSGSRNQHFPEVFTFYKIKLLLTFKSHNHKTQTPKDKLEKETILPLLWSTDCCWRCNILMSLYVMSSLMSSSSALSWSAEMIKMSAQLVQFTVKIQYGILFMKKLALNLFLYFIVL